MSKMDNPFSLGFDAVGIGEMIDAGRQGVI